jgi:hypothetical protein
MMEKFKNVTANGDLMFIEFESGKRINTELVNEFMIMLPAQPKQQPVVQQLPQKTEPSNSHFAVTSIDYGDQKNLSPDSPIYKLLKKQKKNIVEISIKLKLNLPPKELYTVLSGSFDDAESEIIDFVLDGVDIDSIKASLAESIRKNYYSEGAKSTETTKKGNKKETNE